MGAYCSFWAVRGANGKRASGWTDVERQTSGMGGVVTCHWLTAADPTPSYSRLENGEAGPIRSSQRCPLGVPPHLRPAQREREQRYGAAGRRSSGAVERGLEPGRQWPARRLVVSLHRAWGQKEVSAKHAVSPCLIPRTDRMVKERERKQKDMQTGASVKRGLLTARYLSSPNYAFPASGWRRSKDAA
ncbi:hypothetical protein AAFF_G00042130 [Aldrovandia affinis]|uniref:Uncharacterized protein n=1 Tax=Aldrovandia affinis TaxID=143900 RepID=A0AAD7WFG3_9TELE|nr:hypothetical protein AAFF_G00042130 [Aldrovandia affinis]